MGRAVVFARIGKAYQGSQSLGDRGPGDPLMSIGEPACLRRVFDHHVVRQAMPPGRFETNELAGSGTGRTKHLGG